ncbi:Chromosome partition protein smc [hydrothermal vent metagenome]|uniref:Chromosome partition protein smc n=1 Tax=hydrothermal vent metagenome TaxID=652676 RepID=A0A3B1BUL1_9ZZZZ
MRFKSLEMRGFKSFVDETKLEFGPGITAVVGPNGCGKSNIADAIRWVLGEQSARFMRGMKMEDLIFNGSGGRKPTGFAEVSITISNEDKAINTHPYSEYEDITVTRKVYRTGESEYFINRTPCRLKDIVDVFLDTGIYARSFSIIEQGQINKIISSKPEDRRFIIEEAAGVMKYKKRRNAAINKLEASQQNLLRIQDILGELERQRNSLKRQAKKAERYGSMRAEIKTRALMFYSMDYQEHEVLLRDASAELTSAKEKEAAFSAGLSTKRNEMEIVSADLSEVERELGGHREECYEVESSIKRNDQHRDLLSRQLVELAASNQMAKEEIGQIEEDIVKVDSHIEERNSEMNNLCEKIEKSEEGMNSIRSEADTTRADLNSHEGLLKSGITESMENMERINSMINTRSSLLARLEMSDSRIGKVTENSRELEEANAALEADLSRLEGLHGEIKEEVEAERVANEKSRVDLKMTGDTLSEVENGLRSVEDEITKTKSKLESLQELEKNLEGFGVGVKSIMKMKEDGDDSFDGVRGLLAEKVRVPEELERALEAILGERLKAVVVEDSSLSLKAIDTLKDKNLSRTSFVSNDLVPVVASGNGVGETGGSILGRVSDLITLSEDIPGSVAVTLQNTLIARDLESALEIWKKNQGAFTIATLDGDVIDVSGVITGGGNGKGSGAHIMARKRIIEELDAKIATLLEEKRGVLERRDSLRELKESASARLLESDENLRRLEFKVMDITKEAQKENAELSRNRGLLDGLNVERSSILEEKERLVAEEAVLAESVARLQKQREEMDEANKLLQENIDILRENLDRVMARAREEEVALTELRGELNNLKMDVTRLNNGKADLVMRLGRLKASISDFETRRDEMRDSIDAMMKENTELARKKDSLNHMIDKLRDAIEEKLNRKSATEEAIKELEKSLESARSDVSDLSLQVSELNMRVENIAEKADHEFNIPVDDLGTTDVSDIDKEETSQRLSFLRGQLARIGDVNMSALDEYEEVNERFEFLQTQHADLVKSIATLRKTIENINATTSKMFNETYEVVSRNFEGIFKRLFGGGRAEMRLVEIEGKSEPGLEILAQPPGKKIQNLNLLSAGEKAMTALSLLFAVFTVKPSPFCLLDEVDAPLDEANIFRFRDMLIDLGKETQFIIITHSQKTMSFADRLYGITQEEMGISKILAVNLVDNINKDFSLTAA